MSVQIPEQPQPRSELLKGRLAAAALIAATALIGSGCEVDLPGGGLNEDIQHQVVGVDAEKKTEEHSSDPRFRATSVAILNEYFLQGGGALLHDAKGGYDLVTVEHVARSLYGMESLVESADGILGSDQKPEKSQSPRIFVPSIGTLELGDDKPEFSGEVVKDAPTDRYTVVHIGGDEAELIEEAENDGRLSIPELAPLTGKFGDVMTMPLSETGREIPFVLIAVDEAGTSADLVPLYVLDRNLDYEAGMQRFEDKMSTLRAQEASDDVITSEEFLRNHVIIQLQQEVWDGVKAGTIIDTEAAQWLPCMGDSGSSLLDSNKNIIGVLSSGQAFHDYNNTDSLAAMRISREGSQVDASRFCLSEITIKHP